MDIIKNLSYIEMKEYFQDKTDENIDTLFNGQNIIDLKTFIKLILCVKDTTLRNNLFNHYSINYQSFNITYFISNIPKEELKILSNDFLNLMQIKYVPTKAIFIVLTENKDLIISSFLEAPTIKDKLEYIKNIHHLYGKITPLEEYLMEFIKDDEVKYLYNSNNSSYKEKYDVFVKTIYDISSDITFGIELELVNSDIDKFINIPCLREKYIITKDASVGGGLEVVSPILHYNETDLKSLASVCKILNNTNFYANQTCGAHIHVGASFLKTKQDYINLLYLYANTEDIIYLITDRASSQKRLKASRFAQKIKQEIELAIENNSIDNEDYIKSIKDISKAKYRGLNFQNINKKEKNTIEFRMPNGELDFYELLPNIRLFTKLIQISHDINYNKDKYDLFIKIGQEKNERNRLYILLDLLFDNEQDKEIYINRYDSNLLIKELIDGSITEDKDLIKIEDNKLALKK